MFLPTLPYGGGKTARQTVTFGGVRYGRGGGDGELSESLNLSTLQFPALSQRPPRTQAGSWNSPTALFGRGKLCVVDGSALLYDGETVGTVSPGEKQMAAVNTKIVLWPDKKYYDTAQKTFGDLGASVTAAAASFTESTLTLPGQNLEAAFAPDQALDISGASLPENNRSLVLRAVSGDTLTFYAGSFAPGSSATPVTVERKIPDLKLICESNNRLWGCDDTTIWASALGDPLTWYNYDGLSTDSFAVSVGSDGAFTGCCAYGSGVLFWKEDLLHKVMGLQPSEYQLYTYTVQGPKAGCHKSLQVINEVLYYLGAEGVYAYAGGTPALISENFGTRRFRDAAAGTDGSRYYLSMADAATGAWGLWTYDPQRAVWLREDDTRALDFTLLDGELLFLAGKTAWRVGQTGGAADDDLPWSALFYPMDETLHNKKGASRLLLRLELAPGAWVRAELREDDGPWRRWGTLHGQRRRSAVLTLLPGRCDTLQLRLSGSGRCVVKSLIREFVLGSEV